MKKNCLTKLAKIFAAFTVSAFAASVNASNINWIGNLSNQWDSTTNNWLDISNSSIANFNSRDNVVFGSSASIIDIILAEGAVAGGVYVSGDNSFTISSATNQALALITLGGGSGSLVLGKSLDSAGSVVTSTYTGVFDASGVSSLAYVGIEIYSGKLRLTSLSTLGGKKFGDIVFGAGSEKGIIFGNANSDKSAYAFTVDGANGSTQRINNATSQKLNISVEEGVNLSYSNSKYEGEGNIYGGVIRSEKGMAITLASNSSVLFDSNSVKSTSTGNGSRGGAIRNYSSGMTIDIGANSTLKFTNNSALYDFSMSSSNFACGGAIDTWSMTMTIGSDSNVEFSGNHSSHSGGAIYSAYNLRIKGATGSSGYSIKFDGNTADRYGGAIQIASNSDSEIHNATFSNNESLYYGGAVSTAANTKFYNTIFTSNKASYAGGAIYAYNNIDIVVDSGFVLTSEGNESLSDDNAGFIAMDTMDATLSFDIGSGSEYTIGNANSTGKDGLLTYENTNTLAKKGEGVLTLNSNSQNWYGKVDVQAGTLNINDVFGNTANTISTIQSGGKLSGTGTLYGITTVKGGGILAPGNSPGTLTLEALILEGGAVLEIESGDKIAVLGTFTVSEDALSDKVIINLIGFTGDAIEDYLFADSVTFTALTEDINDYFYFSNSNFDGTVSLVGTKLYIDGTFIPEPAEYAALFGLAVLVFAAYRRKRS